MIVVRCTTACFVIAIVWLTTVASVNAETVRIATWNLFNLHHTEGVPLRANAPARTAAEYAVLKKYADDEVDAHIVAFQEVNGPVAAHKVFAADKYDIFVSGRFDEDIANGADTDHIYEGFAVRKGVFDSVTKKDVREIGVMTGDQPPRPTRWGTEVLVTKGSKSLRLLVVHLKSSCHQGSLMKPTKDACDTLARQRAPLEAWIDAQALSSIPFVILGDFNRRFDLHGDNDHLWGEIDDGFPNDVNLFRFPFNTQSICWDNTTNHHADPIDFIVLDDRANGMVVSGSFKEIDYDAADRDVGKSLPSDHCPKVLELDL